MKFLRQSTAKTIRIGPFVDDTDAKTPETALTISQADVRLSKDHGAFGQKNDTSACTHDEGGYYACPLNTTDTATVGQLRVAVLEAGALPVREDFWVLPPNIYDSWIGSDRQLVDVAELNGVAASVVKLEKAVSTNTPFTVGNGSTTTLIQTDLSEVTDNHYNGLVMHFITGALAGQKTRITSAAGSYNGTTKACTVEQLTEAPAAGDLAILV